MKSYLLIENPNVVAPEVDEILTEISKVAPSWTTANERQYLYRLAQTVKPGGRIVEIGCLYGGATAVLCKAAPEVEVISIDEFSWSPEGYGQASPERVTENLNKLGVAKNHSIIVGDSRVEGPKWDREIDFLWIDGGHSYQFIKSDLECFAPHARLIACHDYDNPFWAKDVNRAIDEFLEEQSEFWVKAEQVENLIVLRWNENRDSQAKKTRKTKDIKE